MWEFLQANSTWIILGVGIVLMLAMHGGHGAGHGGHAGAGAEKRPSADAGGETAPGSGTTAARRGGGCH